MSALVVLGEAPALGWLAERAFQQGGAVLRGHHWLDAMLLGGARCLLIGEGLFAALPWAEALREGDVVLDVSSDWFELRPAREVRVRELGGHYLELAGPLAPWGGQYGFALAVGGALSAHDAARLWLDRLAPLPGAWSSVGGAGAAAFTRLVAEAFQFAWLGAPELPCAPQAIWMQVRERHLLLAERLLEAAQRYLALHPQEASFAALLASFLVEAVSLGREADAMLRDWLAAQRPAGATD
ncbi:hypothetical protein [Rivihabitans pingtungensis]|jgi:hypothetical protein|uniref:Uncharacterized protein n=2 Tax=Rivihabitans pingtungensis TaxID=1054498 RepID=A0A318KKN2_9NEIS|nr:hypothetical protein [Rivihabitans pingtungensis]PXX77198.1 hypothetical protein DFR34_1187 [Rivihabitans pingtungensis]